jgi:putative ABC transport system permease protein
MRPLSIAWLQDIGHDARFAARTASKDRSFTAVAVATLALSIGLNATLFTIVSGMDNVPAVEHPERLVFVRSVDGAGRPLGASYADVGDWIGAATSFDAISATATAAMTLTDRDRPAERVAGAYVSAGTFAMLGERPILGRDFRREDDRPGAAPVAIVNASIWKNRYGGDAAIVGRSIDVNGVATTIVGVMRDRFRFPLVHDVWQPLASMRGITSGARDARTLRVAARLAQGTTVAAARQEMDGIAARLAAAYPATNANVRTAIEPYIGRFELANPWNAMLAAVSIVLLIACANIANLLISRAAYRTREIAIRQTLGATRWRLLRQLLVESLLLAFAGGAAGVFVAILGVRVWLASMPEANWPYWYHFAVDRRVLAYIVEVAVGAALVFGIGPALYLSKRDPAAHLTDRSHRTSAAPIARRWSNALLAGQFALTLALLAGAALLARTLVAVYRADAKVETSHVLLSGLDLPPEKYSTPRRRVALYTALEERVAAMSGVDAAGLASGAPFYTAPVWSVSIDGSPPTDSAAAPTASYVAIGARYFDTLRLRPLRGRVFSDRDGTPGFDTAIVNELFASRYFRGGDALGRRIRLADPTRPDPSARWLTIVGITPTVRQHYAEEIDAVVYVPYRSDPAAGMVLLTRASGDPAALTPALREQVHQLDPDLPLVDVRTLTSLVDGTRFGNKVFAAMFSLAAGLGLLLAAIGLHAVTAYAIARRTAEIGIRMALGARPSQVIWLFVAQTAAPLACGFLGGLAGAFAVGRFVSGMLIGTSPHDPATLAAISLTLVVVVLAAAFVPARRAARIDPAIALRYE